MKNKIRKDALNVEVEIEELTTVRLNKLNLELEVQGNQ
jgi:hypothetical protein